MAELEVLVGDITALRVDAIVNAANTTLLGGGGVDGAIHRAAGPELKEECEKLGGCATGDAKITKGYRLPAKFVIHAVGPVWRDGSANEEQHLRNCYARSLVLAGEKALTSIAFPCISTGVYRFPKELAARIAVTSVREALRSNLTITRVIFACFSEEDAQIYNKILQVKDHGHKRVQR